MNSQSPKKLLLLLAAAILLASPKWSAPPAYGQTLPVGTRKQPLLIETNSGLVSWGSNVTSSVTWTNATTFSNSAPVTINGVLTNNGTSIVSNEVARGALSTRPSYTVLATITNNDFSAANKSFILITNANGVPFGFTGFAGGVDGQRLSVINMTPSNMFILDGSSSSTVSNRIDTTGFGSTNTTGPGSAEFIYQLSTSNWMLRSFIP